MSEEDAAKGSETLASIRDRDAVAKFLGVRPQLLKYILYKLTPQERYREFEIRKRNGESRQIRAPIAPLKKWQSQVAALLGSQYKPPRCAFGYIAGRNIQNNAAEHLGPRWVLRVDLQGFFPSISFGRVMRVLMAKPFSLNEEVATTLAKLCCYDRELPQGSPASPVISNILCLGLDYRLSKLARSKGCVYSRYCDDLVLSTDRTTFPRALAQFAGEGSREVVLGAQLVNIIAEARFAINPTKTRLRSRSEQQLVTGLVVNQRINVPRKFVRTLRVILHEWERRGTEDAASWYFANHDRKYRPAGKVAADFASIVRGKVQYLGSIRGWDDFLYLKHATWLASVDDAFSRPTTLPRSKANRRYARLTVYVEGPTDRAHIEMALAALQRKEKFRALRLDIDGKNRGSGELLKLCKAFQEKQHVPPCVFVFDNDEHNMISQFTANGHTMSWGNGVFSMCLPRPSHLRATEGRWCIEMLYRDADFMRTDPEGRRLFRAAEFKAQTGKHLTLEAYTTMRRGGTSSVIVTSDVFNFSDERNMALSKIGFVRLIERHVSTGSVDFSAFEPLFEELVKLQNQVD
jgi:RNA-directed DNA polymerase